MTWKKGQPKRRLTTQRRRLREVEVEAVQTDHSTQSTIAAPSLKDLDQMSIDDLRKLAAKLDIPDRGQIVEKDKLVAAIRQRM